MQLSLLASFAESESVTKSESIKWGIRNRFARKIPRMVDLYGFDRDGLTLTINPDEGPVVAQMYQMLFDGYSPTQIAKHLTSLAIPTPAKAGGDVLIHKTVTVDIFTHKTVKNTGQERSYRLKNYHQGIVSYDEWLYACVILGELPFDTILPKDAPGCLINGTVYKQINMSGAKLLDETSERK